MVISVPSQLQLVGDKWYKSTNRKNRGDNDIQSDVSKKCWKHMDELINDLEWKLKQLTKGEGGGGNPK